MKRLIIAVALILGLVIFGVEIKDVSTDVPQYEAVKFVVEKNIMNLYEGGKFDGARYVTRYDVAQYIYNLVKYLLTLKPSVAERTAKVDEIFYLLGYDEEKKDFRRVQYLEETASDLKRRMRELESWVNEASETLNASVSSLEKVVNVLREDLDGMSSRIDRLNSDLGELKGDVFRMEASLTSVSLEISSLMRLITRLRKPVVTATPLATDEIEAMFSERDEAIRKLTERVAKLERDFLSLRGNVEKVVEELAATSAYLSNFSLRLRSAEVRLDSLQERVTALEDVLGTTSPLVKAAATPLLVVITEGSTKLVSEGPRVYCRPSETLEASLVSLYEEMEYLKSTLPSLSEMELVASKVVDSKLSEFKSVETMSSTEVKSLVTSVKDELNEEISSLRMWVIAASIAAILGLIAAIISFFM